MMTNKENDTNNKPIETLGLSDDICETLNKFGIYTTDDIKNKSENELRYILHFNIGKITETLEILRGNGIVLSQE